MMKSENNTAHRDDIYRLLAACYYSPTRAFFEEKCCDSLAALLAPISPEASRAAMDASQAMFETTPEELAVEHARLFIGPFKLVAPPYGSFYLDESRTVMGESTVQVLSFYQANGLKLSDDFHELPDHIAVELEFMSYLAFREQDALESDKPEDAEVLQSTQQEFLSRFLLPWLDPFTAAIIEDAEAPFYEAVARCTASFVAADNTRLNNLK